MTWLTSLLLLTRDGGTWRWSQLNKQTNKHKNKQTNKQTNKKTKTNKNKCQARDAGTYECSVNTLPKISHKVALAVKEMAMAVSFPLKYLRQVSVEL